MPEPWIPFAIDEINRSSKPMTPFEKDFMKSVEERTRLGVSLSPRQIQILGDIHRKKTEIGRIPRRGR